jgi:K+-transporting ATPase c subunit
MEMNSSKNTQYNLSLPLSKKNSTIDAIVNETHMTALHFKTMARIALRSVSYSGSGLHNVISYDLFNSFSKQYRRELRAALKYEVRYGC